MAILGALFRTTTRSVQRSNLLLFLTPYVVRDQQLWLEAHLDPTGGPEAIAIVSRAYALAERPGAPAFTDCVIARCTARRRGVTP